MGALHNFIRIHEPTDEITQESEIMLQCNYSALLAMERAPSTSSHGTNTSNDTPFNSPQEHQWIGGDITAAERQRASEQRDEIAQAMWEQYQAELHARGEL